METYMVNNLVRNAAIVLQNVEIHGAAGFGDILRDWLCAHDMVSDFSPSAYLTQGPCGVALGSSRQ
jgi:hypothetical protein